MRKPITLGIVCISCWIAFLATGRVALGQAGSIGGTIGKTDKSAAGGEEQTPESKTERPKRSSREDRCSIMNDPAGCRCALKTGGFIYPSPLSSSGYRWHYQNRARFLECMARR
jgi:hypothetical protein